jgi:hypothetical protein
MSKPKQKRHLDIEFEDADASVPNVEPVLNPAIFFHDGKAPKRKYITLSRYIYKALM